MDRQVLIISSAVVFVFIAVLSAALVNSNSGNSLDFGGGDAAIIQLSGTISPSSGGGLGSTSGITPSSVRSLNERATNQGADAIIYEINSGGGAVVASKEVMREIESVDVPTVCRFRDLSASGAYLFALGCDSIVADSSSMTGSIGVISSYLEFSGLLEEFGIEYVNITSGEYKDVGSQYRNATPEEKEILENKADKVHEEFIELVDQKRNLSESDLEEASTGEPFLGERAKRLGLVDRLGGRQTAIDEAENLTGEELETFNVETQPSFNLFSLLAADMSFENFLERDSLLKAGY